MRGKSTVAVLAIMWIAQPQDSYLAVLNDYLTGNADAAVQRLLAMDSVSVSTAALGLPRQRNARLMYAAAAIHTEAVLLPKDEAGYVKAAYNLELARDIVQYGEVHVRPRRHGIDFEKSDLPPVGSSFRRVWYVAALQYLESRGRYADAELLLERTRELYPNDSQLTLLDAIADEAFATPRFGTPTNSQRLKRLRSAERKLAAAVAADPSAAEARLRQGRVLQQLGRLVAAHQALLGLSASTDARLRYLSSLFLGSVSDQAGNAAEAAEWYRRASGVVAGQAAVVARSELLYRSGEHDAAVQALSAALEPPKQDPWWSYPLGQFWLLDGSRAQLRALARQ